MTVKISATIITFNEERNIQQAIESVKWADEIVVVDSESTDNTRVIAENLGARVLINSWPGFSKQKQFAVEQAVNDWILSIDADERITDELKAEIKNLSTSSEIADGYRIPRLSYYMGRPIRHGGWYPDWQLRLFDRRKGKWKDMLVHESVGMSDGSRTGNLNSDIQHFSVEGAEHHHRMIGERYAPLAARQMFENGQQTSLIRIFTAGFLAFFRAYFLKGGFLDGLAGFAIARFAAHHAFLKHLILLEIQEKGSDR
ncbi:MAG: glycosyltransferase family 2 protein [Blastocatellia bacterium]